MLSAPRPPMALLLAFLGAILLAAVATGGLGAQAARAQPPRTAGRAFPPGQRVADVITLRGGRRLLGMLAAPDSMLAAPDKGVQVPLYVRRQWLAKHHGELFRQVTADEAGGAQRAVEELLQRALAWRERSGDQRMQGYLDHAIADTRQRLAEVQRQPPPPPGILLIEIPTKQIVRSHLQPPEIRRLLALAWQQGIDDAEQASAAAVVRRLKARDVDVEAAAADLAEMLPPSRFDARQWAAKMALVEYQILGKPHFQGTGGLLIRDDSSAEQPAVPGLLAGMLTEQLEGQLAELLDPHAAGQDRGQRRRQAIDQALRAAEREELTGVRISELSQNAATGVVTVEGSFLARMPDGQWQDVWRQVSSVDIRSVDAEAIEALRADPRIAEVLKQARGLGVDAEGPLLEQALRHGAATRQALDAVNRQFGEFLVWHTSDLDGPRLDVADAQAKR